MSRDIRYTGDCQSWDLNDRSKKGAKCSTLLAAHGQQPAMRHPGKIINSVEEARGKTTMRVLEAQCRGGYHGRHRRGQGLDLPHSPLQSMLPFKGPRRASQSGEPDERVSGRAGAANGPELFARQAPLGSFLPGCIGVFHSRGEGATVPHQLAGTLLYSNSLDALHLHQERRHPDCDIDFNVPLAQGGGDTVLHFVLRTPRERFQDSKEDIVKLLLRTGTNPLRCDRMGDTALHLLAGDTRPAGSLTEGSRLLRLLLEGCPELREPCSGSIDKKNDFGDTPLFVAILHNNIECARLLLKHGADPHELGEYGMTALDFAVERAYTEIAVLLLSHMTNREQEEREAAGNETPAGEQILG
ncbi:hypothetical protein J7T55_012003 [Diaporthe amygdali]|uniref:uncharacterized protein n=1 Tax=Phomopsis amygdali TaxID=1214568 RepID=UPI0022FEFF22|nr:uncharacterized protein J7T55_012003 [Diaporthe amygdali]KAJ0123538.1 hypothetical protein J7T55_012003 [Diaporthe amygdali]